MASGTMVLMVVTLLGPNPQVIEQREVTLEECNARATALMNDLRATEPRKSVDCIPTRSTFAPPPPHSQVSPMGGTTGGYGQGYRQGYGQGYEQGYEAGRRSAPPPPPPRPPVQTQPPVKGGMAAPDRTPWNP